jgi:hypothetical protein
MLLLDPHEPAPRPAPARMDERRRTGRVLALALLGTLALRLLYLTCPLGIDEGGVAFIAKAWGTGHGSIYGAYWLDRPPLLVGLYKVAVLAGPLGIRTLGAVAALALVTAATVLARAVAGERAARYAAVLSAVFASSVALASVFTPAELLAAPPTVASLGCLVAAHRRGRAGWLVGAGLLAVSAALVKQSFLDAGFAGAVFLLASGIRDRRPPVRWIAAYAVGALVPLAGVAVWLLAAHVSVADAAYALVGFRVQGLHKLAGSELPLGHLLPPGLGSGLFAALVVGLGAGWTLRGDRVLVATLAAWLAAGTAGVLGGGSYWSHYLIQLVAPASVLAAVVLAAYRRRAVVAAIAALAVVGTVGGVGPTRASEPQHAVVGVARYLRAHARPGDTQYVLYARANVDYYAGLPSPYPYAWSLMVRAIPGARARLLELLDSSSRPTWIVVWQGPNSWHLDPDRAIAHALGRHYRPVARIRGHAIYQRRSPR